MGQIKSFITSNADLSAETGIQKFFNLLALTVIVIGLAAAHPRTPGSKEWE
jgi:hypothetical protein